MSKCKCTFFKSTVGTKFLMAATGLLLVGFLATHLAGNFLLFASPKAFNDYAHALTSKGPLIWAAELGLLGLFVLHIVCAIRTKAISAAARPQAYAMSQNMGQSTLQSRTMLHTGGVILVFLIIHLITFKFGVEYVTIADADNAAIRDLYLTVVECFASKGYSALYIACMILLGFHLKHGFQSAFQTLGLNHPRYFPMIKKASLGLAILFAGGYAIFPIVFGFANPVDIAKYKADNQIGPATQTIEQPATGEH